MPRGNKIRIVLSAIGKQQVDKDTPLDMADLDLSLNVTSRNWIETAKTVEDIMDCIGEEVSGREVTRMLRRLPVEGEFAPVTVAPLYAYLYGLAAAPTGSTANKIFTLTITATGGTYTLTLTHDGLTRTTTAIAFDATAAELKYALESLDNVGFGNTTVGLVGNVYTVEFVGKRAAANIANPVEDETNLTGGTVTIAQTQAGSQRSHLITELTGYQTPYFTAGIAFEDEPGTERLLVGAVMANLRVTGAVNNGKLTFAGDIIARDVIDGDGLVIPECVVYRPIRTADCLLTYNASDLTDPLKDFGFSYDNGTLTGDSAYTGRSIKPSRLERASKRTRGLNISLLGGIDTAIYQEAELNPEADVKRATSLRMGTPGNNITVNAPNALAELQTSGGGLRFDGEAEEAVNLISLLPTKQGSTKATNLTFAIPNATAFLTS